MTNENIFNEKRSKLVDYLKGTGITNQDVLNAILNVPRHSYVDPAFHPRAYDDDALPIGFDQTISSPTIVAKMTQLIYEDNKMKNVLEIGTGCGYQTSILSKLFTSVTTIERIKSLHLMAKKRLSDFNYNNITFLHGDGFHGHKSNSPYDAIIMTASPNEIPSCLVSQLKPSGRIILPLNINGSQKLFRVKNTKNGLLKKEVDDVLFVPMLEGVS
jgi:protein-L-isoaspartate(D-aspartate) O-methyltransferase